MKTDSIAPTSPGAGLREWQHGWKIVLSAALGIAISGSYLHFVGAMMRPLQEAYGWARGDIALGLTLITVLIPFVNLVVGTLADRIGSRPLALWGSLGFGLSFAAWGLAGPALWTWYLFCVLFAVFGHLVTNVIWTLMVVKNFNAQRGLALALALSGSGLAAALTPLLVLLLEESFGVRLTFVVYGVAGALIIFVPALLFFHDHSKPPASASSARTVFSGHTLPQALRDRNFWQFAISVLLVALVIGTFIVHLQPMLLDSGLEPAVAASVALFVGPSMIFGRIVMGMLFDYINARVVSAVAFLLPACGCFMLGAMDGSYALAAAAGVVIGLGLGAEMDVVAYVVSRYFGMRSYGKIFALISGLFGLGIGAGSALSGLLFDMTGSYKLALMLLAGCSLGAASAVASLGKPRIRGSETVPLAAH